MENQVRPAEKPILFSAPMVRAILEGRKTQTRRIVKKVLPVGSVDPEGYWGPLDRECIMDTDYFPTPLEMIAYDCVSPRNGKMVGTNLCPYGQPGDRLWVRETWFDAMCPRNPEDHSRFFTDETDPAIFYRADGTPDFEGEESEIRWRPSIFMPRWASRITLEITDVRVQRLQEISDQDCEAEGVKLQRTNCDGECGQTPCGITRQPFIELWESVNGAGSWDANPWVWATSFKPFPTAPQARPTQ